MEIPNLNNLQYTISKFNSKVRKGQHSWGKFKIDFNSLKQIRDQYGKKYVIAISSVCYPGCESKKFIILESRPPSSWFINNHKGYIILSDYYPKSLCFLKKGHEKPFFFICSSCGQLYCEERTALKCSQDHHKEELRIKNWKIIEESKVGSLRWVMAIWRLYRYLDMSPKEISHRVKMSKTYIRGLVGSVYKHLCLTNKKCVLRDFLIENYQ